MKRVLLAVGFLGLVMAGSSATASMIGQCNSLLGRFLGAENQVVNGIDVAGNCNELGAQLNDFVNAGCVPLFDSGQLFNAHLGPDQSLVHVACTALVCDCGFDIPECIGVVSCP